MSKVLRFTALAATVAALALTTTGAAAAPVSATSDATAKARILKPLVLKSTANFDLGIIVLAGAGPYTATVGLNKTNTFNCDGGSGNVVCSGTPRPRQLQRRRHPGPERDDRVRPGVAQRWRRADARPDADAGSRYDRGAHQLGRAGHRLLGRRLAQRSEHDRDGVYTGTFALTADYQ